MNWFKKVLAVCSFCTLLTTTNCLAVTQENTDITDDKLNCYKTYLVQEDEKDTFIETLDKDIEVFGEKYTFDSYTSEGGTTTDTIDISTTKKITSDTNNLNSIINQLGRTIHYEKDGYIGEYQLNTENIQIKTNYNGFREDLIEETINYTGLERNDLDFIPKQTEKDGLTLDLLNVEWEVETTKMIGEYEVADLYTAKCYYAGKQRVNYPNTYSVTAEYTGTATKEILTPYTYTVKYNKVEEEIPTEEDAEAKRRAEEEAEEAAILAGLTGGLPKIDTDDSDESAEYTAWLDIISSDVIEKLMNEDDSNNAANAQTDANDWIADLEQTFIKEDLALKHNDNASSQDTDDKETAAEESSPAHNGHKDKHSAKKNKKNKKSFRFF